MSVLMAAAREFCLGVITFFQLPERLASVARPRCGLMRRRDAR
jgi:hypothetical protein